MSKDTLENNEKATALEPGPLHRIWSEVWKWCKHEWPKLIAAMIILLATFVTMWAEGSLHSGLGDNPQISKCLEAAKIRLRQGERERAVEIIRKRSEEFPDGGLDFLNKVIEMKEFQTIRPELENLWTAIYEKREGINPPTSNADNKTKSAS